MSECESELQEAAELERRTLWILLAVNGIMFVVEAIAGALGESTGLLADSFDMLADASVYGIALYAVGRSRRLQGDAATASGAIQVMLGIGVLMDVLRRFFYGSEPLGLLMLAVGAMALFANVVCLTLIAKHRAGGIHMRASWIFSTNDVIANLGVILSGALVYYLGTNLPDLIIGVIISVLVLRGGLQILREAKEAREG